MLKLNVSYDVNTLVISAFGLDASADIMNTDPFEEMFTNTQVYKNVIVVNTLIANAIKLDDTFDTRRRWFKYEKFSKCSI